METLKVLLGLAAVTVAVMLALWAGVELLTWLSRRIAHTPRE
jgi:hypothetical protein